MDKILLISSAAIILGSIIIIDTMTVSESNTRDTIWRQYQACYAQIQDKYAPVGDEDITETIGDEMRKEMLECDKIVQR